MGQSDDSVFAIKDNGTLWAWGGNFYGALGLGDTVYRSSPVQVGALSDWAQVNTGGFYGVMAIKTDGTLWGWGYNPNGGLGTNNITNYSSPVQIGALSNWAQVSTHSCTIALKTNGTIWVWGNNFRGQLGLADTTNRSSPVQVGSLSNWSQVVNSQNFMYAVKTDGTLWSWGENSDGNLGLGDTAFRSSPTQVGALLNWAYVECSKNFSQTVMGIKTDGTLWSWGYWNVGRLGNNIGNFNTSVSSPVQVGALTNWAKVSIGHNEYNVHAVKTDGTLWGWGGAYSGQLGTNSTAVHSYSSPIQIGALTNWVTVGDIGYSSAALSE
jgi:alpha-tubulin suppressor-like RCC1 family protein